MIHLARRGIEEAWSSLFKPHKGTEALDGWRAIAMLLLFIFHVFFTIQEVAPFTLFAAFYESTPAFLRWAWGGDRGVDIFFVLSGFLVVTMLTRQGAVGNWRQFYWRRALRLLPVYYLMLLVYWLVSGPNRESLWANVLFINNYLSYEQGAMLWSWSLAVEIQFYLVAPLLVGLAAASGRPLLVYVGLVVVACVWRAWVIGQDAILMGAKPWQFLLDRHVFEYFFANAYDNFGMRNASLIMGGIGGHLFSRHRDCLAALARRQGGATALILGCLVVIFALLLLPGWVYHQSFEVSGALQFGYLVFHRYLFSAAVVVLMLYSAIPLSKAANITLSWLRWPIWQPIARLSYSAYLLHIVAIFAVFKSAISVSDYIALMTGGYWWALCGLALVALLLTWFAALVLYVTVEYPFMRLRSGVNR